MTTTSRPIPNMIQAISWPQAIQAVKDSASFADFADFRAHLEASLLYNSAYTRARYTSTILKYFFPGEELDTFLRRVWLAYKDEPLLTDLMGYHFLSQEPTVAEFVLTRLIPMAPGTVVESQFFKDFIAEVDPKNRVDMVDRLRKLSRVLEFLVYERRQDVVAQRAPTKTSLLILIHHLFAPTPRIVPLAEILAHPFWRCLGFRDPEAVRRILHEAGAQGLIAKYATVDQLEQITTCHTLDAWLEQALRL